MISTGIIYCVDKKWRFQLVFGTDPKRTVIQPSVYPIY